jgi:hypothetical protein
MFSSLSASGSTVGSVVLDEVKYPVPELAGGKCNWMNLSAEDASVR